MGKRYYDSADSNGFNDEEATARIRERAGRVLEVIGREGGEQSICPIIDNCDYLTGEMERVRMNVSQVDGHMTLICEKYPMACELNTGESIKL